MAENDVDEGLGINTKELLEALSRNAVPLPYEIGTFIALQACECLVGRPAVADLEHVWVSDDGEVTVEADGAAAEHAAARSVVTLLGQLLVRSAPGVPAMLLSLVERDGPDASWQLAALRDELEASLVPLNRAAAKRVLARVLREAHRERRRPEPIGLDDSQVAAELDRMLGVDSQEADRVRAQRARANAVESVPVDAPELPSAKEAVADDVLDADVRGAASGGDPARSSHEIDPASELQLVQLEEARPRRSMILWLILAFAIVAGAVALLVGRDDTGGGGSTRRGLPEGSPTQGVVKPKVFDARRAVHVTSTPHGAQVLMRVGRGGEPITGFAIGEAHELVVIPPQKARPVRIPISGDAPWSGDGALALEWPGVPAARMELGPTRIGPDLGRPTGRLGTVTLKAPADVVIYKLVGLTPNVRLEGLPSDRDVELLLYRRGYRVATVRVTAAQLDSAGDSPLDRTVELASVTGPGNG